MMMPKLARGVSRLAPVGRVSTGLQMSNYTCNCQCMDGQAVCGNGETEQVAHSSCTSQCTNLGTSINPSSCNYQRGGSCD